MKARQVLEIKIDTDDTSNDVLGVGEPGDYAFVYRTEEGEDATHVIAGIHFLCPRRNIHGITFRAGSWQWDGNRDKPTITPSIASQECGMHVFMTAGEWVPCGDHGSYRR